MAEPSTAARSVDARATENDVHPRPGRDDGVAVATPEDSRWHALQHRVGATLAVIRANPTGRIALKVGVALLGALVVALGVVLIPLPGPGWAIVILGLAIWAIEFAWAKHLLQFTRRHVQAWTHWVTQQSLLLRCVIGVVGLVFVSTVVWLSVKVSFGINLAAIVWDFVTG